MFATQHDEVLFEMNDAMANALHAFYGEIYGGTLFPRFVSEIEQRTRAEAVRKTMRQKFASKPFTIDDVKRHCMQHTDCLLKRGEYRKLILELAKLGGELERIDLGGTPTNDRTRYQFR